MKNKEISIEEYNKILNDLLLKQKIKNLFWQDVKIFKTSTGWDIYIDKKLVIPNTQILDLLKLLWQNPKYGGVGIERFYNHIKTKYWGITKKVVNEFVNNLESYQLHKKVINAKTINLIVPKEPNYYYQIDLIDMSKYSHQNKGFKWIFTIIDLFTKKAFAFPLLNKKRATVAKAFSD